MFKFVLFATVLLFFHSLLTSNIYAQTEGVGTTETTTEIPVVESPPEEVPSPEGEVISDKFGGKTTCTFRGGNFTPMLRFKTREASLRFEGKYREIGFELFEEEKCEDVFKRAQIYVYLHDLGVGTLEDIIIAKKYRSLTDSFSLSLRTITEINDNEVDIISIADSRYEANIGLHEVPTEEETSSSEERIPSQGVLRFDSIDTDKNTASGVIKIRYKGTYAVAESRTIEGGYEDIRALLRKANIRAQVGSEQENGVVDVICSFRNVPINIYSTGKVIDEEFDEDLDIEPGEAGRKIRKKK